MFSTNTSYLIISTVCSIALIILLIARFKINPAISLIIGSLTLGVITGTPTLFVIEQINVGFGEILIGIGLPIGFGIMLGQLLSDSGGASVIAKKVIDFFPSTMAVYALGVAAFILSIPIFFDVTFVILIPIGIELARKANISISHIVGSISIGAGIAHTLIPPTPNPLAAAKIFDFDLGLMIIWGLIIGLLMLFITIGLYSRVLNWGLWNALKDENNNEIYLKTKTFEKKPSFFLAILPILFPIFLIAANSVSSVILHDNQPIIFQVLGDKTISILLGTLISYWLAIRFMGQNSANESATKSFQSAGLVLLITGAGGSFAATIKASGVQLAITEILSEVTSSFITVLLISYLLGLVFRQLLGSGTVASITSMSMMANITDTLPILPVFVALACLTGSLFGATVNDSGFWMVTNMSGLKLTGGLKTYTLGQMMASVTGILLTILFAVIY